MITIELTEEECKLLEKFRAKKVKDESAKKPKESYMVRAHTIKEAWDLCCTAWQIAEGPQNESTRYADTKILHAFNQADYCYIGVSGVLEGYTGWLPIGWLRIINVHDKYGKKKFKEVSKSKFCSIYGIKEQKGNLPRSLMCFRGRE